MKKKIKVTKKQYKFLNKAYRLSCFFTIVGLLVSFSWLIGKPIEFLLIFIPYFITKGWYSKQWHSSSLKQCFTISLVVFSVALVSTLDKDFSMIISLVLGLGIAYLSYHAGTIQFKLKDYAYIEPRYNQLVEWYQNQNKLTSFNVDTCTEDELLARCKELHFNDDNTQLAVEFFIKKTKQSVLAERLCIEEKSITTRKKRLKEKLNND